MRQPSTSLVSRHSGATEPAQGSHFVKTINLRYSPILVTLLLMAIPSVQARQADLVLKNAMILTMDPASPRATALAIGDDRLLAVGSHRDVAEHIGRNTRVLDMQGRTVVPGLIDTHIHAIRGGQTYAFETYWFDTTNLQQALQRLTQAATQREPSQWVAVVGSWHTLQFDEDRAPTVAELNQAVPEHPAYVQHLYDYALLNTQGIDQLNLNSETPAVPAGITVERDAQGRATGKLFGDIGPFNALFATISRNVNHEVGLRGFFTALNARGVTGFIDPSAGPPEAYLPLFALRDKGQLTLRAGYRVPAMAHSGEAEWFERVMAFRPPRHDDGQIAFLGLGENLVTGMNDGVRMAPGFSPSPQSHAELLKVARFAAQRRIPIEIHAYTDDAASAILDVFELIAQDHDLRPLRWSIAHLNTGTVRTLQRMAALGLAYTVQMGPYFEAPAIHAANNHGAVTQSPPLRAALEQGLMVAGGTDSTRIGVAGVWQAIEYHVNGRSIDGSSHRPSHALLRRDEALRLYTRNAAWLAFDEDRRGQLSEGMLADLAVLDQPLLTMPASKIHTIQSLLTILGGKIVHDAGMLNGPTR